jgi:hypothetical protein
MRSGPYIPMPHSTFFDLNEDIYALPTEQRLRLIQDLKRKTDALHHAVILSQKRYLDQTCKYASLPTHATSFCQTNSQ